MKLVNLEKTLNSRIKAWINKALPVLKEDLEIKTPTKSWELIQGYTIESAKQSSTRIVWKVINETKYANIVNSWVKNKVFNYHKWPPTNDSTIFISWVW